jgi:outer membrane protein OmpA-like peptidoglycan-associated protein
MKNFKYLFAVSLAIFLSPGQILAENKFLNAKSIIEGLSTQPKEESLTRGFKPQANPDAATRVCDSVLNNVLLEKTNTKGEQLTRTLYVETVPKIDLDIAFKRGLAVILPEGERQLDELAAVLKDQRFNSQKFVIAGHTDTEGAADYNDKLSCERALSVRRYLRNKHGLNDMNLIPMGFGFTKLKNTEDKLSQDNRRVEIRKFSIAGAE